MRSAVDTNVLVDVVLPDPQRRAASQALLDRAAAEGALIICEAVYAELSARSPSAGPTLDEFLSATGIALVPSTTAALRRAGEAWGTYASGRRRGRIACPRCGGTQAVVCPRCRSRIPVRQHLLADFLIGAHAAVLADRLLTRDRGYYRTYFPDLAIAAPAS